MTFDGARWLLFITWNLFVQCFVQGRLKAGLHRSSPQVELEVRFDIRGRARTSIRGSDDSYRTESKRRSGGRVAGSDDRDALVPRVVLRPLSNEIANIDAHQ